MSLNSSIIVFGKRYGYISNNLNQEEVNPENSVNLYVLFKNLGINNLSAGAGVRNLLNDEIMYIQPYGSAENVIKPYPGVSREFFITLKYEIRN
ncbi:MAG: TonB-dependent receptor [Bacteroidales bacterium]|nr:TonB-dependent receptor [Bacteroidales bacterium]